MYKAKLIIILLLCGMPVLSQSVTSYDYQNMSYWENDDNKYCAPEKSSFLSKVKSAFVGQPTGYTPQIEPSPYINRFGPSYMRGYYGTNGWNDHNTYNPTFSGAKVHILE